MQWRHLVISAACALSGAGVVFADVPVTDTEDAAAAALAALDERIAAEDADPVDVAYARLKKGELHFDRGELEEAERHFRLLTVSPDELPEEVVEDASYNLGRVIAARVETEAMPSLDEASVGRQFGQRPIEQAWQEYQERHEEVSDLVLTAAERFGQVSRLDSDAADARRSLEAAQRKLIELDARLEQERELYETLKKLQQQEQSAADRAEELSEQQQEQAEQTEQAQEASESSSQEQGGESSGAQGEQQQQENQSRSSDENASSDGQGEQRQGQGSPESRRQQDELNEQTSQLSDQVEQTADGYEQAASQTPDEQGRQQMQQRADQLRDAREQIEQAQQAGEQASESLEENERQQASEQQREAAERLREAAEQLRETSGSDKNQQDGEQQQSDQQQSDQQQGEGEQSEQQGEQGEQQNQGEQPGEEQQEGGEEGGQQQLQPVQEASGEGEPLTASEQALRELIKEILEKERRDRESQREDVGRRVPVERDW